jgi:hypothetical protein
VSKIDAMGVSSLVMAQAAQMNLQAGVVQQLLTPGAAQPTPGVKLDLSPAAQDILNGG